MSLGPKVQMINSGLAKPKPAPIEQDREAVAKPVIIHKSHIGREAWAIVIFIAGMATCEVINVISTNSMFDQAIKAVFQASVARSVLDKTTGN